MRRTVFLATASCVCGLGVSAQQHNIDTQKSTLTIHVGKTGVFSGLGHEHEVRASIHSGTADTGAHPSVEVHKALDGFQRGLKCQCRDTRKLVALPAPDGPQNQIESKLAIAATREAALFYRSAAVVRRRRGYYGYSRWGTGGGLGIVGTVLLIAVVLYLLGVLR
jgi:hypothetical protein